jgi:nicotinic acid mononucleotide adenylyltransferase
LVEALKGTRYFIYPVFWGSDHKNPTSTWLPLVKIPEKNLLIGDDSFMSLLSWQAPEKVLNAIIKLYVVSRHFSESEYQAQKRKILEINPNLEIIFLGDHAFKEISSSKLR